MKEKIVIIKVKENTYITKELYLSIINDILKWVKKEDLISYNKPYKILTKKGILVRMGKGEGKYRTNLIILNKNKNLLSINYNPDKDLALISL